MHILLIYLLGCLIWAIGYYIYDVYINKDIWTKKRLIIYKAITSSIFSWFGIIIFIALLCTGIILCINDWIEEKLS